MEGEVECLSTPTFLIGMTNTGRAATERMIHLPQRQDREITKSSDFLISARCVTIMRCVVIYCTHRVFLRHVD